MYFSGVISFILEFFPDFLVALIASYENASMYFLTALFLPKRMINSGNCQVLRVCCVKMLLYSTLHNGLYLLIYLDTHFYFIFFINNPIFISLSCSCLSKMQKLRFDVRILANFTQFIKKSEIANLVQALIEIFWRISTS